MEIPKAPTTDDVLDKVLGYLNFSSGAPDSQFLTGLNTLYEQLPGSQGDPAASSADDAPPVWSRLIDRLESRLARLREQSSAFANAQQVTEALEIMRKHVIPDYRDFHSDALRHRTDDELFGPFLLGRMFERLLQQPRPWDSATRVSDQTISRLNVFLGHRPVPTLQSQQIEPRPHEWVCPIPVYLADAGVATGKYTRLITKTLEFLQSIDPEIARAAYFDIQALEELAIDPRAYDFDHPVNRRPNYHFGEWDPHCIDNQGRYRRFVVRELTLDALMARWHAPELSEIDAEELVWESAAVLAGTILMASGVSGGGPDSHDSDTTLMTLIGVIARYRDAFYEGLLTSLEGPHGERLRAEAKQLRQPLGGARQHLNNGLSRKRAEQNEHVRLALVFARMGYVEAAQRQVDAVDVAAARMNTRMDCAITAAHQAIRRANHDLALRQLDRIVDLLHRGIACGAIVDPWNILGFDANFSLFPALENSVRDHRIDALTDRMDRIFDLFARLWSAAAAADNQKMCRRVSKRFDELAKWWHQFAAHEVASVESNSAIDEFHAGESVALALNNWHRGGAATGDVGFWAPYVDDFDSPKAYALVIDALLNQYDFISSMSLLMHWIGQAPRISLETRQTSFHQIAHRWVRTVVRLGLGSDADDDPLEDASAVAMSGDEAWKLLRRFFDYLEPNADAYWHPPTYDRETLGQKPTHPKDGSQNAHSEEDEELASSDRPADEAGDLFQAAYEDVVFQDSTDDGVDGSIFDTPPLSNRELEAEAERIVDRLAFLNGLARLWTTAGAAVGTVVARKRSDHSARPANTPARSPSISASLFEQLASTFDGWYQHAARARGELFRLLQQIDAETLPRPAGHHASMIDYDRQRFIKETLLDQIIATVVEMSQAERFLLAVKSAATADPSEAIPNMDMTAAMADAASGTTPDEERSPEELAESRLTAELHESAGIFASMFGSDREAAARGCEALLEDLPNREMLYVPLSKSGQPWSIAAVRIRQSIIEDLLIALPRLGLVSHGVKLIETVRLMEHNVPSRRGAVTQFDELFEAGFREIVQCLVRTTESVDAAEADGVGADGVGADTVLIDCLEQITEVVLRSWLDHSRTLRLSVLERARKADVWDRLVEFIQTCGSDLFTASFLTRANVRAILHCGVDSWLTQLEESGIEPPFALLEQLDQTVPRKQAVECLTLTLESVLENYGAYLDYNATTTQSDRGEKLYMLLDFLRLQADYDRVAWNLRPVFVSHEVLVRRSRNEAAQLWRRALTDRVGGEADRYIQRLRKLQSTYAMRLNSVADRLGERFLRPMTIDRMRALVQPAIQQLMHDQPQNAFDILEDETRLLMREPSGSGLDIPQWLRALEEEVERIKPWSPWDRSGVDETLWVLPLPLDLEELMEQLDDLTE